MGTSHVLLRHLLFAVLGTMYFCTIVHGQHLYDQVSYEAFPSCTDASDTEAADQDYYFLKIKILSIPAASDNYEVLVNGIREVQFHVDTADLPYTRTVGPYLHSTDGGIYNEVTLRSLDSGLSDDLVLSEVICGYNTQLGSNMPGFHCSHEGYDFIAQTAPDILTNTRIPEKQYIYVLVDELTDTIARVNRSGIFKDVADLLNYEVHAYSLPFSLADNFESEMIVGEVLDSESPGICYAFCGSFSAQVDCESFDLALRKELGAPAIVSLGDTVTYAITVINEGVVTAYDIVVSDMKPDGLSVIPGLNPGWNDDLEYHAIDSISAGKSATIYVSFRVDLVSPFIRILNNAEIIFATRAPGSDLPAFDVDSTPGNEELNEDDQDEVEIMILQNLCQETFDVGYNIHAPCIAADIHIDALVNQATRPVIFVWVKDGKLISTDSTLIIANPTMDDYGEYGLTILDKNGCQMSALLNVEPILNDFTSCPNDINVSVNADCHLDLKGSSIIHRDISGIDGYILVIRDPYGNLIEDGDVSHLSSGDILEIQVINPCNGRIMCWTNAHLEYKFSPLFDNYTEKLSVSCLDISSSLPTDIIADYNKIHGGIYSAAEFQAFMEYSTCIAGWTIEAYDAFYQDYDDCDDNVVSRVYVARNGNNLVQVDTVLLEVESLDIHSILFPDDVSNLDCHENIDPAQIFSNLEYLYHGELVQLNINRELFDGGLATLHCNIAINYTDDFISQYCSFGAKKVLRRWTIINWCTNEVRRDDQFLFIIDDEAPVFDEVLDTLVVNTEIYACAADVDLSAFLQVSDNCDDSPGSGIKSEWQAAGISMLKSIPLGMHSVELFAEDDCGNLVSRIMIVEVRDHTPPAAILLEHLVVTMHSTQTPGGLFVGAQQFDSGSHDFGCGNIHLLVARKSELDMMGDGLPLDQVQLACDVTPASMDVNHDGVISPDELFGDKIKLCCSDIGNKIEVAVRVYDDLGLYSEAGSFVFVDYKEEGIACDDQDPCTRNDVQYGNCPCSGIEDNRDADQDGILDCADQAIVLCYDGASIEVALDEAQLYLDQGASAGPCPVDSLLADIGGEVYTLQGDMIAQVALENNQENRITLGDGKYVFEHMPMYQNYALTARRNDEPLNGVTALNLVRIQEHILGIKNLDDNGKLIAADINNDGRISAMDLFELKQMILGLSDTFRFNQSWRFVVADALPPYGTRPFPFVEVLNISSLDRDRMEEDWIGIKIGDVTGDARTNDLKSRTRTKPIAYLNIPDRSIEKDQEVSLAFNLPEDITLDAFQFEVSLGNLDFVSLRSGEIDMSRENFAVHSSPSNTLSFVWYDGNVQTPEGPLFFISVRAKGPVRLSKELSMTTEHTANYLYDLAGEAYEVQMLHAESNQTTAIKDALIMNQNKPNPFNGSTLIEFIIPRESAVTFTFFNIAGERLHEVTEVYKAGSSSIKIEEADLNFTKGLIYYQMAVENETITRSMIVGVK